MAKGSFNVLKPIKSKKQLKKRIRRRTKGLIRGEKKPVKKQRKKQRRIHAARKRDVTQSYDFYDKQLKEAADEQQVALNELLSTQAGGNVAAQGALSGALGTQREADRSQATIAGGPVASGDQQAQALAAAASSGAAGQERLGGIGAALGHESSARRGTAGLGRLRATERESDRFGSVIEELDEELLAISQTRPEVRESVRTQIIEEELRKRQQRQQEKIAAQEFGLAEDELGFRKSESNRQFRLDERALDQQQQQIDNDIKKGNADKRDGQKFKNGVSIMEDFIERLKDPKGKSKPVKKPHALWNKLRHVGKMSEEQALKLMKGAPPAYKKWAIEKLKSIGRAQGPYPYDIW